MDSSEWELSKENVQPIKQGRKIPNLTAALTPCGVNTGDDSLYWKLQKDKQNFEAEIRTYEGEDFLDIWYRYILWTEENVPKGGREIGTLLERCIKEFQDVTKYENDERHLNVWLKYTDCCADPLEIFNYLHMKGTCSGLALLYIAWASACENVGNFQKADQVLMLGIEKNAQPLEILQKHHIGFQHRLTAHIAASEEIQSGCGLGNQRKTLGSLVATGNKKMVGVLRTTSFQNPAQSRFAVGNPEKKGLDFSILHDSDDSENRISQLPEGRGNEWKEAPTESVTSKENINMPGKWTREKAHSGRPISSTVSLVRPTPKQSFHVHVDENAEQIGHVHQTVGSQVLSVKKSDLGESSNPLKVIANSAENTGPSNVKIMYDKSKVYAGTEEFQFEEIRAAKYMARLKQGLPLRKDVNKLKREYNRTEQPEEMKERVMYPKNKVYAYEGEFQLEELMARRYYERRGAKIPGLACTSVHADTPVLENVGNVHSLHGDARNITVRSSAKKSLPPRIAGDSRVKNDAVNIPPSAQDISVPKNDRGFPELGNVQNIYLQDDAQNIRPSHSNTQEMAMPKFDREFRQFGNVQNIRDDTENIPPPNCSSRGITIPNSAGGSIPPPVNVSNFHITHDDENIPPPNRSSRGMTIPNSAGRSILPPVNVSNFHITHDDENIPPPNRSSRGMTIPNNAGGSIQPPTNVPNFHISHDDENIPPPNRSSRGMTIPNNAGGSIQPPTNVPNFHISHDDENIPPPNRSSRGMTIPNSSGGIPPPGNVPNFHISHDDENIPPPNRSYRGMTIPNSAGGIPPPTHASNFHISHDDENIPPPQCNTPGARIPNHERDISLHSEVYNIDAENVPPSFCNTRGLNIPKSAGGIPKLGNLENIHIYHDAENLPPPQFNSQGTVPTHVKAISPPSGAQIVDAENIPPPNSYPRGMTLPNDVKGVSQPDEVRSMVNFHEPDLRKNVSTPDAGRQLRKSFVSERSNKSEKKNNLAAVTPKFARYKLDLTGPSPTLTTKLAFADVMPWFNTTVGLSTSDDELENVFKNDDNDDDFDQMGWCGIPFGEGLELKKQVDPQTKDVDNYCDENQENLPPFGYSQAKVDRPVLGILQPSVGIPFEPLQDFEHNDEAMAEDKEQLDEVSSDPNTAPLMNREVKFADDEMTQNNWLNHSQFTAAARLMSTPFEENLSPPKLESLHCSSIQPHDEKQDVPEHASNVSTSSYNADNSKGLSPILERSDEDAKNGSSKGSSHLSGLLVKSNVQTTQSMITNQTEATFGHDMPSHTSELQNRSMDITVHDMNGTVLKKINPFDPELCNQLLSQLPLPITSFPGYHDFKENVLPIFASKKVVPLGDEVFQVNGIAGSGAYAKVFSANKVDLVPVNAGAIALKVQRPANDWEFYICSELSKRMKNRGKSKSEISSMVNMTDYYAFADGSCSVTEYHERGTFLDFVNQCKKQQNIPEEIAFHFALEMMKILECIHDCGIIHGDIKPDNFVLFDDENLCRLGLIDFGCAIDVELFPPGTRFSVDKNTESFECIEMKMQRPWTTQVDTYGMLCSLHCLVFGEYMKVYQEKTTGRWRPTKSFNRTWNRTLWNKLFDMFLNIPSCDVLPSLAAIRQEFQKYSQDVEDDEVEEDSTCDLRASYSDINI